MTPQQIALVKNSWIIFQSVNPMLVGDVFYSKLFLAVPALRSMFSTPRHEQSKKLVEMLNVIVGRLDKPEEVSKDIAELAVRHVGYGVRPEHYQVTGAALLWTLEQGLGKDWTPAVADAWQTCYAQLAGTMIEAAQKARQ